MFNLNKIRSKKVKNCHVVTVSQPSSFISIKLTENIQYHLKVYYEIYGKWAKFDNLATKSLKRSKHNQNIKFSTTKIIYHKISYTS